MAKEYPLKAVGVCGNTVVAEVSRPVVKCLHVGTVPSGSPIRSGEGRCGHVKAFVQGGKDSVVQDEWLPMTAFDTPDEANHFVKNDRPILSTWKIR